MIAATLLGCTRQGIPVVNPRAPATFRQEDRDRGFVILSDNLYCVIDHCGRLDVDSILPVNQPRRSP